MADKGDSCRWSVCTANIPPKAPRGPEEPRFPKEREARPTPPAEEQEGRALVLWGYKTCLQKYSFCRGETNSPTLDHCLSQKDCESGSGAARNWVPRAKSSKAGTEQGGTDLIFNSISKKGVQGVTGGVDTSGISDKKSRGGKESQVQATGTLTGAGGGGGGEGSVLARTGLNPGIASCSTMRTGRGGQEPSAAPGTAVGTTSASPRLRSRLFLAGPGWHWASGNTLY